MNRNRPFPGPRNAPRPDRRAPGAGKYGAQIPQPPKRSKP